VADDFDLVGRGKARTALGAGTREAHLALEAAGKTLAVRMNSESDRTAKTFFVLARNALDSAPGRYSKSKTRVVVSAKGVGIAAPWAAGAEWGSNTHTVFGRKTLDRWGIWPARKGQGKRPKPDEGYILGAAWRAYRDPAERQWAEGTLEHYSQVFDQFGIPKGGF
jgi:hypothetical protein